MFIEASATFINVKASTILNKWFGESNKLVSALFSLGTCPYILFGPFYSITSTSVCDDTARLLAPTVLFIDEIDTLLRNRDSGSDSSNNAMNSIQGGVRWGVAWCGCEGLFVRLVG